MIDSNFSGKINLTNYTSDPYGIVAKYNKFYGNVQLVEGFNRFLIYTFGNESWLIDAYELEAYKARNSTPVSRMHRREFGKMYCGLDIRMDCHEFVSDKL